MISIGQELAIPPTNGVLYKWKDGDKLEKIIRRHYKEWVKLRPESESMLDKAIEKLVPIFDERNRTNPRVGLPTDKLLGAVHMFLNNADSNADSNADNNLLKTLMGIDE